MTDLTHSPMGESPEPLSKVDARKLTDEAKERAHVLWMLLLRLYEGEAYKALEYKTWGQYFEAEFGGSQAHSYRLLAAGRVLESLEHEGFRGDGSAGSPLLTERGARELSPLLRNGAHAVKEAYQEAVESANGDKPTASEVREVVRRRRAMEVVPEPDPTPPPRPEPPAWEAELERAEDAMHSDVLWLLSSSRSDAAEVAELARKALQSMGIVFAILDRLAGEQ